MSCKKIFIIGVSGSEMWGLIIVWHMVQIKKLESSETAFYKGLLATVENREHRNKLGKAWRSCTDVRSVFIKFLKD